MKFGLSEEQFKILNEILIQPLKKKKAKVYIFGSRARGKSHPFSDVDVLFEESADSSISAAELSKIKEELEESRLTVTIDIVSSKDLAKSFVESVQRERVEV